jgi:hypothetical protein
MRRALFTIAVVAGFATTAVFAHERTVGPQKEAPQRPSLTGTWKLNRDLTYDMGRLMKEMEAARAKAAKEGKGGKEGKEGTEGKEGMQGREGERGGRAPTDEQKKRMQELRALMEPPGQLTIADEGTVVSITDDKGRVRRYTTDGKKEKQKTDTGEIETKARWKDEGLEVETDLGNGVKLLETYANWVQDKQLVVTVLIESSRYRGAGQTLQRVYDAAQ